jgi:hypothetical protein
MAFLSGSNMGGKNVDYYDNPNYDPKNQGKSKGDKKKSEALEAQGHSDYLNERKYTFGEPIEYEFLQEADSEAAYAKLQADKQVEQTVSYFRAKERERLNPGGTGKKIINEKFSQPSGTLDDKLGKFGFSYDPEDPDNYYGRVPEGRLTDEVFQTDRYFERNSNLPGVDPGTYRVFENTVKYEKGNPLPNTVAGVNKDLQARKTRTRDFAMEFRGTVFDFIEDVRLSLLDEADAETAEFYNRSDEFSQTTPRQPLSYLELENKYFPDEASRKAAKTELKKLISFTDKADDLNRNYSPLSKYAETIARTQTSSLPMPVGIGDYEGDNLVDDKITAKNYTKNMDAYSKWKSKKGIPKIVRLISKLG